MKKIVIFDGGPRKNMNTGSMIEAFKAGAESVGQEIEVKRVRLYEIDYKDCYACMACKVKDSKFLDVCGRKDGLTESLREAAYADGIVFASPIYFSDVTAQLRAVMTRLFYPWLSYKDFSTNPPRRVPTATIYTMNANDIQQEQMQPMYSHLEGLIEQFLSKPERISAFNTTQVKNYDRYVMDGLRPDLKKPWRDEHWEKDLQHAFDAGKRMAEKIMAAQ